MNIQPLLEPQLWTAIRSSYESRAFTGAVLDALHFMGDLIRERAGLESDGVVLVGEAFGGESPRLKVNRLQTDSERNVQRGVEQLLRGLYQAIRNPRSHEKVNDDERDATAIILMIDYLARTIDRSRSPFSITELVSRILDPAFVPKDRYADLIIERIPVLRRLQVCVDLYARRAEGDAEKMAVFFRRALPSLSDEARREFFGVLSEDLEQATGESTARFVLQALPGACWTEISETARLRIEHMLIQSIREGRTNITGKCAAGAFGTWMIRIHPHATLKDEMWHVVLQKLASSDRFEKDYATQFFLRGLPEAYPAPSGRVVTIIRKELAAGSVRIRDLVSGWGWMEDDAWRAPFTEALESFTESSPAAGEDEDIPF